MNIPTISIAACVAWHGNHALYYILFATPAPQPGAFLPCMPPPPFCAFAALACKPCCLFFMHAHIPSFAMPLACHALYSLCMCFLVPCARGAHTLYACTTLLCIMKFLASASLPHLTLSLSEQDGTGANENRLGVEMVGDLPIPPMAERACMVWWALKRTHSHHACRATRALTAAHHKNTRTRTSLSLYLSLISGRQFRLFGEAWAICLLLLPPAFTFLPFAWALAFLCISMLICNVICKQHSTFLCFLAFVSQTSQPPSSCPH